ncbi:hypothetical protein AVEN_74199-1 [Araneus ventricosus]|uniref:Uncharacterized protein n=1 Tax=Araneus ventricosus TaxID=182803 RepID=A0A4Y2IDK9_ARAVE|nr:hypothetical protein AVEN_74199-1 [Araneus ventricosus]
MNAGSIPGLDEFEVFSQSNRTTPEKFLEKQHFPSNNDGQRDICRRLVPLSGGGFFRTEIVLMRREREEASLIVVQLETYSLKFPYSEAKVYPINGFQFLHKVDENNNFPALQFMSPLGTKRQSAFREGRVISALMNDPSAETPGMMECPKGVVRSHRTDNGQTSPELPLPLQKGKCV